MGVLLFCPHVSQSHQLCAEQVHRTFSRMSMTSLSKAVAVSKLELRS